MSFGLLAKDSETSGLDAHHLARLFFFSTCDEDGNQCWLEADVNPLTREVKWSAQDIMEYEDYCNKFDRWVYQSAKFDIKMESVVGVKHPENVWSRIEDTLVSGHLLASNHKHDLTTMAKEYLDIDIQPLEDALEKAVKECRYIVQQARLRYKRQSQKRDTLSSINRRNPTSAQIRAMIEQKEWDKVYAPLAQWMIAEEGLEGLPSSTGKDIWRSDYWLPRAMAKHFKYKEDHPWHTVLRDYANADTAITMSLWKVHERLIRERGQWAIYRKNMELVPILYDMEMKGVTVSKDQLDTMTVEYQGESERLGSQCVSIANRYETISSDGLRQGYQLILPDNGVNASLRTFLTDILQLPAIHNPKAKTDAPTLNKDALEHYQDTLEKGSIEYLFVNSLLDKRQIDTALSFMDSYRKFGRVMETRSRYRNYESDDYSESVSYLHDWLILNPSYKITGTTTTRLSSYGPNAQQISKKSRFNLRRIFGPTSDREWWSLDAKNIELRLPAYESGEQDLIDLFEKDNEPPYYGSEHLLNFHTVYPDIWNGELGTRCDDPNCCNGKNVTLENVGPHVKHKFKSTWYQRCKNGGFAVGYGAIDRVGGTADRTFGRPGSHARLKQRFSKKEALNQKWIRFAEQHGYVETMPDKTVDPNKGYPLLCTRTLWGGILPTVPLNFHIQGTAGIWMRNGMCRVQPQLDEWNKRGNFYARMVMTVHDELVFDFPRMAHPLKDPKNSNLWRIRVIQKLLEQGGMNLIPSVPTPVSISYHSKNWAEEESIS